MKKFAKRMLTAANCLCAGGAGFELRDLVGSGCPGKGDIFRLGISTGRECTALFLFGSACGGGNTGTIYVARSPGRISNV